MEGNLWYIVGAVVLIGLIAILYPLFYRSRKTQPEDELNWVNKSNYNIATSESEAEAINDATPREAEEIAQALTEGDDAIPVSDEEFYSLNDKMKTGKTEDEVKRELRDPFV